MPISRNVIVVMKVRFASATYFPGGKTEDFVFRTFVCFIILPFGVNMIYFRLNCFLQYSFEHVYKMLFFSLKSQMESLQTHCFCY